MGSKKPEAKAIVSFSSDSDEDDSSSSSSRLSSSASSGEDSEVETFSVAFPAPAPGKTATQGVAVPGGGGGEPSAKVESKTRPETKRTEPVKAVSPEPRKSPVADVKDKSALKRTNVSEESASKKDPITAKDKLTASDSNKEVRKSPGKQEEASGDTLDVTRRGGNNSVSSERPKSPKITINDVDEEDSTAKQTKKSPGNDVTLTSSKPRAASPKKTSNDDVDAELPSLSLKSRKDGVRAVSPKKEDTAEDVSEVVAKTPRKSSKLAAERVKSPKDTEEEQPASVTEVKSADRAKSPKKTAVDKDAEKAKSPKKISEDIDTERAKSPKKTAEDGGEAKKKSSKESSKTPYELLRSVDSPEKSPTRSTKPKKSLTTEDDSTPITPKRKSPLKDLDGKEQEDAVEPAKPKKASKKTGKTISGGENDDVTASRKDEDIARSGKVKEEPNADSDQSQKTGGVSEAKVKDQSDTASEVEQLLKEIRQKRITSQLESETPEGGGVDKLIRVDDAAAGKTDDASKTLREAEVKDPSKTPREAAEVKDKDYMKVSGPSRKSPADETTGGTKPDLENEESEFTYRRKSMDDFIKRILAEAKEERLKQKGGGAASNDTSTTATTEGDERKVDRYTERNGGITENGLDGGTKWNGGGGIGEDKEGSMLDRRLAKIEKRRFGESASDAGKVEGGGGVDGSRSKVVGKETEGKSGKDKKDYDVNLDEDLEEINRFLQSRKTAAAASRFDFDEPQLNDDDDPTTATTTTATPTKRRWATTSKDQLPAEEDDLQPRSQIKKKYSSNVDVDYDEDDDRFIGRYKRDSVVVPEESFSPRRRDETDEIIRERTRNVRVLVDQQVEIVQAMRTTSKSLDDLEKEIREVRQVCLNRQARIEALEGALGAEYRAFENDQVAATDRQKDGSLMGSREDFGGLAGTGRLRRQDKFKSESLDEENFPFRRRSGSVASTTSYTSGFEGSSRGRPGEDGGLDSRPPSGLKQSRRTSEGESDLSSGLDRRRGGSAARDRIGDVTPFGPDDLSNPFLSQRSARSRASIATSTPAIDYAGAISGDSFLAKIRAKYSFLNPALDNQSYSCPSSNRGYGTSGISSYTPPSSLTYGKRLGSRDILSSPSAYSSYGTGGLYGGSTSFATTGGISGGRFSSIRDSRSPSYGSGGFVGSSSSGITGISSSYGGDSGGRMRRAQSVSEMSFDRPSDLGSSSGGEFHSRFLDKVRGKKAMGGGDDVGTSFIPSSAASSSSSQTKGQEKPFKSRFLKTTSSFDAGSSRSDRLTNGFDDGNDAGGYGRGGGGGTSEINGDA